MSTRGVYSLCDDIQNRYILRKPDIGAIIERDASMPTPKTRQTTETGSGGGRLNHASPEPMDRTADGGQRSSLSLRNKGLKLKSRVLRRLFGERERQQDNTAQATPLHTQSQLSVHSSSSSVPLEIKASIRARTERHRTRVPVTVFASSNDEPGLPPPYSGGPAVPSYDVVIEEEWRRIRSLRRRTLDDASNTATSWCRPGLPSSFFDRQRKGQQRRREWRALEMRE